MCGKKLSFPQSIFSEDIELQCIKEQGKEESQIKIEKQKEDRISSKIQVFSKDVEWSEILIYMGQLKALSTANLFVALFLLK